MPTENACQLCREAGGEILWQDELCRLVLVADADYPGTCRIVWKHHVAEMTDLDTTERRHLMSVVFAAEAALRATSRPDKINLASLGNVVPHLHWHVIPRWRDDRHFPNPIWGAAMRDAHGRPAAAGAALREAFVRTLAEEQAGA
ncbi:MAG: HIT family protein [Rhodocyclales bacterium]|nr:HIT family protein [Rhodocyclales bacterium]